VTGIGVSHWSTDGGWMITSYRSNQYTLDGPNSHKTFVIFRSGLLPAIMIIDYPRWWSGLTTVSTSPHQGILQPIEDWDAHVRWIRACAETRAPSTHVWGSRNRSDQSARWAGNARSASGRKSSIASSILIRSRLRLTGSTAFAALYRVVFLFYFISDNFVRTLFESANKIMFI